MTLKLNIRIYDRMVAAKLTSNINVSTSSCTSSSDNCSSCIFEISVSRNTIRDRRSVEDKSAIRSAMTYKEFIEYRKYNDSILVE
jgi:hypothetical protein